MACATSIVKYLVFLFNLLCLLAGIAFIVVGVVAKIDIDAYTGQLEKVGGSFWIAPTFLIIVGCIVFLISFLGCCGALRESSCMLTTYAVILLTLLILQVGIGVYAFLAYSGDQKDFKADVHTDLQDIFKKYNTGDNNVDKFVDSLQENLQCCGVDSYTEWPKIPSSCCEKGVVSCIIPYQKGCFDKLWGFLEDSATVMGIVVIVIGITELVAAIIGLCLSSSLRNEQRRYYS